MNGFLILSLLTALWRPAAAPVGPGDLQLAYRLAAEARSGRLGSPADAPGSAEGVSRPVDRQDVVPGRLVVGFVSGRENEARALVKAAGGVIVRASIAGGDFLVAAIPGQDPARAGEMIRTIGRSPVVRYAEPLMRCHTCFTPNDSCYARYQWGNWAMYADEAWNMTLGLREVKVGIVDEGIDYTHPDLAASFDASLKGYDFVDRDSDPMPMDSIGAHGTHVGGIVAAGINNSIGTAGWANITLLSCRVMSDSGWGYDPDIADGIRWATDQGVRVINLSLGGSPDPAIADAVDYAWNSGVLVVAASGNEAYYEVSYPAAYDNCMAVGALDTSGVIAWFSNYGTKQELIAPGVNILSTVPGGRYEWHAGTSMACPEVVGLAALIFSLRPELSNRDVRAILDASAMDMGQPGRDRHYGFGLANAGRALSIALAYGGEFEPLFALTLPKEFPSVMRAADLKRLLPDRSVVRDALGREHSAAFPAGVYFIRTLAGTSRITVVD